jgi:hypothetical protein
MVAGLQASGDTHRISGRIDVKNQSCLLGHSLGSCPDHVIPRHVAVRVVAHSHANDREAQMQDYDQRESRVALIASIVFVLIFALTFWGIFGR